ncbi:hypothetical protein ACFWP2_23095 [Kitasatospora sp. NPDC058444]|uniref:hypothetical protein n=1 Tax=Kitasatospora sp. NPDC058444 TaxID=3346504 RepID=UPI0036560827
MPQEQHEEYLIEETAETVEPDEKAPEGDTYDEVAERRSLGADPATDVADVVEQTRAVRHDEEEYRE